MRGLRTTLLVLASALAAFVLTACSLSSGSSGGWPASGDIGAADVPGLVSKGARLVDVRTPVEYAGGHIPGAENVPVEAVTTQAGGWDPAVPVIVYCQVGSRSLNAAAFLKAKAFAHVYNLRGGIAQWSGEVVQGSAPGGSAAAGAGATASGPATGRPVLYDFSSDT